MADTNLAAASLDSSLGSLEIGVFAALTLYGLMVAQMHTYYQSSFQYDSRWLRFIVRFLNSCRAFRSECNILAGTYLVRPRKRCAEQLYPLIPSVYRRQYIPRS